MKIVMINHTFQQERFYKRWHLLATQHPDLDITLLAPDKWDDGNLKGLTYGKVIRHTGKELDEGNFHIRLIDMQNKRYGTWISSKMVDYIKQINPDIVYHIGEHRQDSLMQLLDMKKKGHTKAKIVCVSMRGHQQSLRLKKDLNPIRMSRHIVGYTMMKHRVMKLNKYCDAVFCHYPDAVNEFRKEGYKKPIYMQTQVGVDTDVFHPDILARQKIRNKYNIGDSFLFGSASRFNAGKGLEQIIKALPQDGNWKYLLMGWGREDEVEKIKQIIKERGFDNRIILTGFIEDWKDMAEHWNALDCAIHYPLTTPEWEETFSLALVQMMATHLPVIGSSSGSVPYQMGENGLVVQENNIEKLNKAMFYMMENEAERQKFADNMYKRAIECFSITHLNDCFYHTIIDVNSNVYDERKQDMTSYLVGCN